MDGFTHLAGGGCPPIADLMLALAAEFRDVDANAVDERLDELALGLFGLAGGDLRVAAARLAELLDTDPGFDADRTSVAGLWFDTALEARVGHPLVLAAIAAEIGRRAGLPVHVLSAPTGWYAGLADRDRLWLVDATMNGRQADPWSLRRHCTHELAFAALLGLSERFERIGDPERALQARVLRTRLPLRTS